MNSGQRCITQVAAQMDTNEVKCYA